MGWTKGKQRGQHTHCKRGHEMTPDNTWTRPNDGKRYCRTCQKATRSYKVSLKGKAAMCRRGKHERTAENTLIDPRGHKHCQACMFEDRRAVRQIKRGRGPDDEGSAAALAVEQAKGWQAQLDAYLKGKR